jgi:hypothetical protein
VTESAAIFKAFISFAFPAGLTLSFSIWCRRRQRQRGLHAYVGRWRRSRLGFNRMLAAKANHERAFHSTRSAFGGMQTLQRGKNHIEMLPRRAARPRAENRPHGEHCGIILSVLTLAWAMARSCSGLAITIRFTCGAISFTTAIVFASRDDDLGAFAQTFGESNHALSHEIDPPQAASAKLRWMSSPTTRMSCSSISASLRSTRGNTTTTDPRSQRNRVGRRDGQNQMVSSNHTPTHRCNSYRHSVFRYRKHSIQSAMETV